jgi:glycosyltransferase involved in cell wall biosynthesis
MKIALFTTRYNWPYLSVVRSIWERLPEFAEVHRAFLPKDPESRAKWSVAKNIKGRNVDVVLIIDPSIIISRMRFPRKVPVVVWGLSDPMSFTPTAAKKAALYASSSAATAQAAGGIYLPPFADQRYFRPEALPTKAPVVFIGTGRHRRMPEDRLRMVARLRSEGIRVVTWGYRWPRHPDARAPLSGVGLSRAYGQAHLALYLTRTDTNIGCRIFQAPMCGTPVITRRRPDVQALFTEDEEALYYDDDDELVSKVQEYLRTPHRLEQIGQRARARCLAEHDVDHRLGVLVAHLKRLVG